MNIIDHTFILPNARNISSRIVLWRLNYFIKSVGKTNIHPSESHLAVHLFVILFNLRARHTKCSLNF